MTDTTTTFSPRQFAGKTRDELFTLGINELGKDNIFCPSCDKVVYFNIRSPQQRVGKCQCGTLIIEWKNGNLEWGVPKNGKYEMHCLNHK